MKPGPFSKKISLHPPVTRLLGIRLVKAHRGRAVCKMKARREHENFMGFTHGGILCDLMDAAMGYAFTSLLKPGESGATVDFKIQFLMPVFLGDEIRAEAWLVHRGKTISYFECALYRRPRKLAAKASALFKLFTPYHREAPSVQKGTNVALSSKGFSPLPRL